MDGQTRSGDSLDGVFTSIEVNADCTEGQLVLNDGSQLCFCHRVGERWARAVNSQSQEDAATLAGQLLAQIKMFRLNAKHLEIWFVDGSSWEKVLRKRG